MPENLIPLLIIGALAFGNWLLEQQRSKQAKRDRPADRPKERDREDVLAAPTKESDEERQMRRFFEALGLPSDGEAPVPPFVPPSSAEKRRKQGGGAKQREGGGGAAATPPAPAGAGTPAQRREATTPPPVIRREPRPGPPVARPQEPVRRPAVEQAPVSRSLPPGPEELTATRGRRRQEEKAPTGRVSAAALEAQLAALRRSAARSGDAPIPVKSAYTLREKAEEFDREALLRRLSDVKTIREAYVLREILGPPKALQE